MPAIGSIIGIGQDGSLITIVTIGLFFRASAARPVHPAW
jgi:hypothetical protein